jgi:hypothetical protein
MLPQSEVPVSTLPQALVVFAKAPRLGEAKTRLYPLLGPVAATEFAVCLVRDTFALARELHSRCPGLHLYLAYTPDLASFSAAPPLGFSAFEQRGDSFGARLGTAFAHLLAAGYAAVVAIGVDSPTLPPAAIEEALDKLSAGTDVVIAPADDGGYGLLGLRSFKPELFAGIEWSTSRVTSQTVENAGALGLSVGWLDPCYDVDVPADFARLQQDAADGRVTGVATLAFLRRLEALKSG